MYVCMCVCVTIKKGLSHRFEFLLFSRIVELVVIQICVEVVASVEEFLPLLSPFAYTCMHVCMYV